MNKDLKVLIDEKTLSDKVKSVADEINSAYNNNETLVVVCVLKGAVMFYTDLVKHLKMPVRMEFVTLSSYGSAKVSCGKVNAINLNLPDFENQNVLIVEDILDTGLTLDFLIKYMKKNCSAKDIKLAVLFDKKCKRKYEVAPDFTAFEVDDKFIVGYGLDYDEKYRNLNYIGYFE